MDRRDFIKTSIYGAATAAIATVPFDLVGAEKTTKRSNTPLRLSFQEGTAPGKSLAEKFDYMEKNGIVGFEPNGKGMAARMNEFDQALKGRNIKVSAICAGFNGFILAEDPAVRKEFDTTMKELIVLAGELGSTGVIMVPAFNRQLPVMPHTAETRAYLVEQMALLGDYALKHNTTVILEPLNRREAHYLRQVADAASICRDANNKGVKCMGDFWHMTHEEVCDYGAFYSAGEYLQHVHIASRGNRKMPGEDGAKDNYVNGFKALKETNYPYYVSFECGSVGDRAVTVPAALKLIREQWEKA